MYEDVRSTEEDYRLPRTTIEKIIHDSLSPGRSVNKEGRAFIISCAAEFITYVTSEAHNFCIKSNKKTIMQEHVYSALSSLGYEEFIAPCKQVHEEHVNIAKKKPSKIDKFKTSGLTMEELHQKQMELFKDARKKFENDEE